MTPGNTLRMTTGKPAWRRGTYFADGIDAQSIKFEGSTLPGVGVVIKIYHVVSAL